MADKKLSKQELKAPDALQKAGNEARAWLQERERPMAALVVGILIVGTGIAIGSYVSTRNDERAAKEFGAALRVLERPVSETAPAEAADGQPSPFKSQKEKDEAAVKELSDFRSQHSGTRAADSAALPLAQAEYRLGSYNASLGDFQSYLKTAAKEEPLRAAAYEGEGYAYEAMGQLDQALTVYEQMARDNKSELLNGMGMFHRGRVLALENKKDEAAKAFQEVVGGFPGTAAARLATERLAILASQGITAPAVAARPQVTDAGR